MSKPPAFTPIEKRCIARDCTGYPLHGFGRPGGTMQWACRVHKGLLSTAFPGGDRPSLPPGTAPLPPAAGPKAGSVVVEQPQTPATPRTRAPQGRLL
jgi:hypothetical protein